MNKPVIQMRVLVYGRVQGVCFRANTARVATRLGIVGTVKNLPDGTVEIYAQGSEEQLHDLLNQLKSPTFPGSVDRFETTHFASSNEFQKFSVIP